MFPTISVKEDIDSLARWARFVASDQLPFATALALTQTARDAADAVTAALPDYLDKPTPFTRRAFRVRRAEKRNLTASVYAMDAQAQYLFWQVEGGVRQPTRVAQKLPTAIKLNEFGNIPKGEIARLIQLAQAGKRLTKARGARLGISSEVDLYYGDPGNGMPVGIYKRVVVGSQHKLIPLVVFPKRGVHYAPRLPMRAIVERTVRARFAARFSAALDQALRSAR